MTKAKITDEPSTYRGAGVDIEQADQLVSQIKHIARTTHRPGVMDAIGGFGALFEIPPHYQQPVLVAGTDGVGTKLKLAQSSQHHHNLGIDLVAMCVNDILTLGAEPLFFLDYFATSQLDVELAKCVIAGIADGCRQAKAALIGGETAEMPGIYQRKDYDLAGFCVGVVEKTAVINGEHIKNGNALIALASSGAHANGFSLIRHVLKKNNLSLDAPFAENTLIETLLTPTRIYSRAIEQLKTKLPLLGMAHITGGGILENLPRCLPNGLRAIIDKSSWQIPEIFTWLQDQGSIAEEEMWRTFNLGVGMIICLPEEAVSSALTLLEQINEPAWLIGHIETGVETQTAVVIR